MVLVESFDASTKAEQTFVYVGSLVNASKYSISPFAACQINNSDHYAAEFDPENRV